jgi:hypothetical protein
MKSEPFKQPADMNLDKRKENFNEMMVLIKELINEKM